MQPKNSLYTNLTQLLIDRAEMQPQKVVFRFLQRDGERVEAYTYQELHWEAQKVAAALLDQKVSGERALLLYHSSLEYIRAFFGCLYAGVTPIPLYPPRNNRHLTRVRSIIDDSSPALILTTGDHAQRISKMTAQLPLSPSIQWMITDQVVDLSSNIEDYPGVDSDSLAFLQYTSGSTSNPKGVMVSHKNLFHNFELMKQMFNQSDETVIVTWLPMHHDMGLIGNILQTVYLGATCTLMDPVDFVQKPIRWLKAVSDYQATFSGAPNFAYELCATKITEEQMEGLDLSSWKAAFNGAEPVLHETIEKFYQRFRSVGFRKNVLCPCYGLAENTLCVTANGPSSLPKAIKVDREALMSHKVVVSFGKSDQAKVVVSCGTSGEDQRLLIVDPETGVPCLEGQVGEIWVEGSSVAQGYWGNPEQTQETFHAIPSSGPQVPFLRTGDLGFLLHGELYVTGRLDDLIIIRGQNYYPQDIELTVEETDPMIRAGCSAAFFFQEKGNEGVVIVAELERKFRHQTHSLSEGLEYLEKKVRNRVVEEHQIHVHEIVFIRPGGIPKTSSNKIQRKVCKKEYINGDLKTWSEWL